jgi:hypothetical protein
MLRVRAIPFHLHGLSPAPFGKWYRKELISARSTGRNTSPLWPPLAMAQLCPPILRICLSLLLPYCGRHL